MAKITLRSNCWNFWGGVISSYSNVYIAGTSKGGTAAIYFGLEIGAKKIFAGACQYHIGSYLYIPVHMEIFKGMMGQDAGMTECEKLNNVMPQQIEKHKDSCSEIHLIYSKKENTYPAHIKDLIKDLKAKNLKLVEKECYFEKHSECGYPFIEYITNILKI